MIATRTTRIWLAVLALLALGSMAAAADTKVPVSGSSVQYASSVENKVGDKQVKLVLTGAGLRKRTFFSVYTIGSYLEEGAAARNAAELAEKDCPKQLHLVMERDVGGKDMAEAFLTAIRSNYAEPKFAEQLKSLSEFMQAQNVKRGDHVWLTHIPKVGLHCSLVGKAEVLIKDVAFAQAVWEIYLGKNNISDALKKELTSRLK